MTIQSKLQQLQEELQTLEKEVGDVQEVITYLRKSDSKRKEAFAYTNTIPDEEEFVFNGCVDGKEVSISVKASNIVKCLENNPKIDILKKVRIRMEKIEHLLREDVWRK